LGTRGGEVDEHGGLGSLQGRCGGAGLPEYLKGRVCYSGLDLSSSIDLTALVHVFPPRDEDEPGM